MMCPFSSGGSGHVPNRIFGPWTTSAMSATRRQCRLVLGRSADIAHIAKEPECADVHLLRADLDKAAAGIQVVICQLLFHLPMLNPYDTACSGRRVFGTRAPFAEVGKRRPHWEQI